MKVKKGSGSSGFPLIDEPRHCIFNRCFEEARIKLDVNAEDVMVQTPLSFMNLKTIGNCAPEVLADRFV
ncbi:hypothetical protein ACTXT7_000528 [Hymenolepis weldensis]